MFCRAIRRQVTTLLTVLTTLIAPVAAAVPDTGKAGAPLKVVICAGEGKADLKKFGDYLEQHYNVKCLYIVTEQSDEDKAKKPPVHQFKGLQNLEQADVILSNLYRTSASPEQLEKLKKAFLSKPVVGLRKAAHGFQNWLEADKEVFGVKYKGHYGMAKNCFIQAADKQKEHPLVKGVNLTTPGGGTYGYKDVAPDVEVLMVGGELGKPGDPQTWTRVVKERGNQKVFYTRYDPKDVQTNPTVRDMVIRALCWAADRDLEKIKK